MSQKFKRGERVKHATKTEWGIGEVLADESGGNLQIFFEDDGPKIFDPAHDHAKFVRLSGSDGESDYLTALVKHHHSQAAKPTPTGAKKKPEFKPFAQAVANFLGYFPAGFRDPAYRDGAGNERAYKMEAHLLMTQLLNKELFLSLLRKGEFKEISDQAKRVVGKTNLISPYEKIWLSNSLAPETNQKNFAESLYDLLYGQDEMQPRFERFAEMLAAVRAAKWPIATYFPFITFPKDHMFLKPVVTQDAAAVLGQEINYRPELNWLTYSQVLALAERIRKELYKDGREDLKPQDMIDVQSFIWVTAPGYFQ
jgi:hypothetical protein